MLVLAGILASAALWAAGESLNGRVLGTARLVQLRATGLTEAGLAAARALLARDAHVESARWQAPAAADSGGSVEVNTQLIQTDHLPPGFSASRFIGYQHELAATSAVPQGASAHRTQAVMVIHPYPLRTEARTLHITLQDGPLDARLEVADSGTTLRLVQAQTGELLWSGGTESSAQQQLFDAASRFAGSYVALDTDTDGLHDRIYAGDLAGRLWRVELHNGMPARSFATARLFADFSLAPSGADGRSAFMAPPDISLQRDRSGVPWLLIAIGTAGPNAGNRIYLLRDDAVRPDDAARATAAPVTSAGLQPYTGDSAAGGTGYFVDIGPDQALASSITVDGKVSIAIARVPVGADGTAPVAATTLEAAATLARPAPSGTRLARPVWQDAGRAAADQGFIVLPDAAGNAIRCSLAGTEMRACSTPVPVLGLYWRREDAD